MKNKKLLLGIAGCALVTIMSCPAYAEDIKVVDGDGMEYTFTEPIKSAVVYDRYNTELFRAVGAADLMVGVDQNAVDTYPQYWDGVGKTLDIVGQNCTDFNVEKIVTLNPDAVFTSSLGEYENMREQLADFDIPVLVVNAWIPSEYYDYIQLVGDVTGNSEQAEEYIDFCKSAMETVTTGLENIPEEERKTVYFENNGENKTCLPGSGWNDMIVSGGGINIFGDIDYETADQTKGNTSAYEIDPEAILDANPDVIIDNIYSTKVHGELEAVVDLEEGELEDELASFVDRAGWDELTAVKDKQVYGFTSFVGNANSKLIAINYIAKWLYPEKFEELDPDAFFSQWCEYMGFDQLEGYVAQLQ